MALYKYQQYINKSESDAFDQVYEPGASSPHSGIYRCDGCGHEITHVKERALPKEEPSKKIFLGIL